MDKVSAAKEAASQAIARAAETTNDVGDKTTVASLAPESESSFPEASVSTEPTEEPSSAGEPSALPPLLPQDETAADLSNKDYTIDDILNEQPQEYQPFGTVNESMSNLERSLHYDFNQSYYSNNTYTYLLGRSYSRSYSNMSATKVGDDTRANGSKTAEDPKAEGDGAAAKDGAEQDLKVASEDKDGAEIVNEYSGVLTKEEDKGEEAIATDGNTSAEKVDEDSQTNGVKTEDSLKAGGVEEITEGDAERASKVASEEAIADSVGGVTKNEEDKSL